MEYTVTTNVKVTKSGRNVEVSVSDENQTKITLYRAALPGQVNLEIRYLIRTIFDDFLGIKK